MCPVRSSGNVRGPTPVHIREREFQAASEPTLTLTLIQVPDCCRAHSAADAGAGGAGAAYHVAAWSRHGPARLWHILLGESAGHA